MTNLTPELINAVNSLCYDIAHDIVGDTSLEQKKILCDMIMKQL